MVTADILFMKKPPAELPSRQLNCPITLMADRIFVRGRHVGSGEADGGESVCERERETKVKKTNWKRGHKSAHVVNLLKRGRRAGLYNAAEALG